MAEILIFSGTTEGRELAEALCARQIDCVASVATEYGREVMRPQEHLVIREGRNSCEPARFLRWWTPHIPTRWR